MTCDLIPAHIRWMRATGNHAKTTIRAREQFLTHADQHLDWGIGEANEAEIIGYKAAHADTWSRWTKHTYDTHFRSFFDWGVQTGRLHVNPMLHIPKPRQGDRTPNPCTREQLLIALTAPRQPWRMAVLLAMYAGLRCCEIVSVCREDIIGGRLRIHGKGGKVRWVPVAAPLLAEVENTPEAPALVSAKGHRFSPLVVGASRGQPLTAQTLTQMQRPVWRRLGLDDGFRLHRCRHWFATSLLEAGADIRVVQDLLGHASLQSTQGYTKVTSARMAAAVDLLPNVELGLDVGQPKPATEAA